MLLGCSVCGYTQETNHIFRHITRADGLVSNQVSSVLQDSRGFMWIGTQTGLQCYDGKRFRTYFADVHNPEALQSDWIQTLFEDSKKRLWIGTTVAGVSLLNRNTEKFHNFNLHLQAGGKKINGIWKFLEDTKGQIWLAATDGFYKLNERTQHFEPMAHLLKMHKRALVSSMALDAAGNVWFATTAGVKMLSARDAVLHDSLHNPQKLDVFYLDKSISAIAFDQQGNTWLSTGYDHVLYRFSKNNTRTTYTFDKRAQDQKPGSVKQKEFLGGVSMISSGKIIVSLLSRGLALYDHASDTFHIVAANNNDPYSLHLQPKAFGSLSLTEDREKNMWIATDAGIQILPIAAPPFLTYGWYAGSIGQMPLGEVSDVLQSKDGSIFVSYYMVGGGIQMLDKQLRPTRHVLWDGKLNYNADENQLWGLFQDQAGIIWAPNQAGNILQLNPATGTVSLLKNTDLQGSIHQLKKDGQQNTWVAHDRKGLLKIDASTKKVTAYRNFLNATGERRRVRCLLPDSDKIWVGTIENGLQLFNPTTGLFEQAFMMDEKNRHSITNNTVISLLAYNGDTLILGTLGGINIFNKNTKRFSAILSKDGLPNNLVQAMMLDSNKMLWAAFAGGLSKINLKDASITNYDASDGIIDDRFNAISSLTDGRMVLSAARSFLVFNPYNIRQQVVPPDVTITSFAVFEKKINIDAYLNKTQPLLLDDEQNSFRIEFASLQFTTRNLRYYYRLAGVDQEWLRASEDQAISYTQLPPGKYTFQVKAATRDGVFCKNTTTLAVTIVPPYWQRWWFWLLAGILFCTVLYYLIKWREKNIAAVEAEKTKLQQLTANNYKAQFESEQISNYFSTSLINKNKVDDVLWDVGKNLIAKLGFADCMIYLWNESRTKMVQKAGFGAKGSLEELEGQHFDVLPGQGVVGAVMASGEPVLISDTTMDPRYRVDDMERLSEICVPIKFNEQLLGVIDSEHPEKNFFTQQHLQALTTIATLVGSKIVSIQAEERLRQQKAALADVNDQLAEVQLAALRSQMNPHFIFNALNAIKKFVIANEPGNAEKYLGKFSKLIRSILDNSRSGMVTMEKEIQLLHLYLELEQLRFGEKLTYSITVDDNLYQRDVEIPSMIVQPFVENAMLHGIMHLENDGKVDIRFVEHLEWLEVVIEDNGVGRARSAAYKTTNTEPHHSIGIQVTTKRLQALKKSDNTPAGITITDLVDAQQQARGTKVTIAIPIF